MPSYRGFHMKILCSCAMEGSRPMTVRDQFAPVLAVFAGPNPPERVRLDLDLFIDYWRDCILALDPPAHRSISSKRLQEKGRHAVVIPTFGGPALRPAVCHFEFLDVIGTPGLCDLRVQRVRQGFRRKVVLGKKHRFNPPPENLICFGSAEKLRTLIYSQRGRPPETRSPFCGSTLRMSLVNPPNG